MGQIRGALLLVRGSPFGVVRAGARATCWCGKLGEGGGITSVGAANMRDQQILGD